MIRTTASVALCLSLVGANFASAQTVAQGEPHPFTAKGIEHKAAELSLDETNRAPTYAKQGPAGQGHKPQALSDPSQSELYTPINGIGRMQWVVVGTIGPRNLAAGLFTSAYSTALNNPREYGPGWVGFGKRYGIRLTGIAMGNLMEAGVGSAWGEDPRYFRAPGESFGRRVKHVIKLTFATRRRDGGYGPAYARFIAVPGNNFLSNTWRADSESRVRDALVRTVEGFLGQMASNAFGEFWPDLSARIFHHRNH